ncbi:MAG: transposase [Nitrobacter sp.]
MARLARVVIPGHPHHVTQRGNGRARTFFGDSDYALYRDLLAEHCRGAGVEVWAWCLMPNHVHLILVPSDADGLRRALARVHRRYAGIIQARRKRSGHFWQGRFGAVAMDEQHLAVALRYVLLNPVRARLVERAQDWRWSSVRAHLRGKDDGITALAPIRDRFPDLADLLASEPEPDLFGQLRAAESIGRPLGDDRFLARLERLTKRSLKPGKRGPKPSGAEATGEQ